MIHAPLSRALHFGRGRIPFAAAVSNSEAMAQPCKPRGQARQDAATEPASRLVEMAGDLLLGPRGLV
jgi:hypothetical protein